MSCHSAVPSPVTALYISRPIATASATKFATHKGTNKYALNKMQRQANKCNCPSTLNPCQNFRISFTVFVEHQRALKTEAAIRVH